MTTRMIGALIMVHGDNSGLVLPPRIAPVQAVVIPIQQRKEGVLEKAEELTQILKAAGIRVKTDATDKSPGFKFAEQEMRGIPVRIECGPKDIENGQAVICRRDTREKYVVKFEELAAKVQEVLDTMQKEMLERARAHRDAHTYVATNYEEFKGNHQQQAWICEGYVVRQPRMRRQDQRGCSGNLQMHAFPAGAFKRRVRMLRKAC